MLYTGRLQVINNNMMNWVIVRSLRYPVNHAFHVPLLSPPEDLFYDYLKWRRQGQWTQQKFDEVYVPRFLKYLHDDPLVIAKLNELFKIAQTQDIRIVCFCDNEAMCHRSIIAGLLRDKNLAVASQVQTVYKW
jgi:uncharacterized protein YeaO (DUF488 family)